MFQIDVKPLQEGSKHCPLPSVQEILIASRSSLPPVPAPASRSAPSCSVVLSHLITSTFFYIYK